MTITDELVERCAEVAYEAIWDRKLNKSGLPHEPWQKLNPYWKPIYRAQARAVLEAVNS